MENESAHFTQEDRKTLTKVETKLDRAIEDISNLTNNFSTKEELKVANDKIASLNTDVETLKTKQWIAIGGIAIITAFVIPLGVYIFNSRTLTTDTITKSVVEAINQYNLSLEK